MTKDPDIFDLLKQASSHILILILAIIVLGLIPFVVYWVIVKLIEKFTDTKVEIKYKIILFIFLAAIFYYYLFFYMIH